jgi:hypothetical protein
MRTTIDRSAAEAQVDSFPLWLKARLTAEIYRQYADVRRLMKRGGLNGALEDLRGRREELAVASDPAQRVAQGIRIGHAVTKSLRILPTDTRCLMQSLVLLGMLKRRGVDVTLVIAVRTDDEFAAHAWVEHEGTALLATEEPDYVPLAHL